MPAMFINKGASKHAYFLQEVVRVKDSHKYNPQISGVVNGYFPINFVMLPLAVPILLFRNQKLSEMVLKL